MMNMMRTYLATYVKDEDGQGMVEYGLIIALIAILVMGGLTLVEGGLNGIFSTIATALTPGP